MMGGKQHKDAWLEWGVSRRMLMGLIHTPCDWWEGYSALQGELYQVLEPEGKKNKRQSAQIISDLNWTGTILYINQENKA